MPFLGYSKKSIQFLTDLDVNNNREWFNENKEVYEEHVKYPTLECVEAMVGELSLMSGCQLLGKVFRLHRDVRFSKDKRPYNAWIHLSFFPFTEDGKPTPGHRGYYLGLEPGSLTIGAGFFELPKQKLATFRHAVAKTDFGPHLAQELEQLRAKKHITVDAPDLKRVPQGFDSEHPLGYLLKHKQVLAWNKGAIPKQVYSAECVHYLVNQYTVFLTLFDLLGEV